MKSDETDTDRLGRLTGLVTCTLIENDLMYNEWTNHILITWKIYLYPDRYQPEDLNLAAKTSLQSPSHAPTSVTTTDIAHQTPKNGQTPTQTHQ